MKRPFSLNGNRNEMILVVLLQLEFSVQFGALFVKALDRNKRVDAVFP